MAGRESACIALNTPDRDPAFRSINSKRLDFAIFDRSGRLVLAIEYQGSGHYHQKSFMRDAVKKEALRKAGVPLIEVPVHYNPNELTQSVLRALPIISGAPTYSTVQERHPSQSRNSTDTARTQPTTLREAKQQNAANPLG